MSQLGKVCFKCQEYKPYGGFYPHGRMGDGYLNKCKDCTKKDARQHRLSNSEVVREKDRTRSRLPERVAARADRTRQYRTMHPERYAAHSAVSYALRSGRLAKTPCAFCGDNERLEAHHHDYSKPLDVTWLCSPCHRRFHALEQMATYEPATIAAGEQS
jgi:hypothetical protein